MTVTCAECDSVSDVFRNGLQNPALVLHDEEHGNVTELEDLSCVVNEQNACGPTAINVENSKDVIIGPVTQFHGPVTIYRNFNGVSTENGTIAENKAAVQNGKLVKSESTSSDSSPAAEKATANFLLRSRRLAYIGIATVLTVIVVVTTCTVMLPASKTEEQITSTMKYDKTPVHYDETNYPQNNNGILVPVKPGSLITRAMWGAKMTNYTQPLQQPTSLVIICHTSSSPCETYDKCTKKVLNIQEDHINRGFEDISYNFLIGGDYNIYVGRGWDTRNTIAANSVSIAFIGNYVHYPLPKNMSVRAKALIEDGVKKEKLSKDYKVVCHNQTKATLSPGHFVYEEVMTWPNYDPSSYLKNKS